MILKVSKGSRETSNVVHLARVVFNKRFLQSRKLKRTTSTHRPLADHPDLADPGIQALDGGRQENEQRTLVDHYVFMIGRGGGNQQAKHIAIYRIHSA